MFACLSRSRGTAGRVLFFPKRRLRKKEASHDLLLPTRARRVQEKTASAGATGVILPCQRTLRKCDSIRTVPKTQASTTVTPPLSGNQATTRHNTRTALHRPSVNRTLNGCSAGDASCCSGQHVTSRTTFHKILSGASDSSSRRTPPGWEKNAQAFEQSATQSSNITLLAPLCRHRRKPEAPARRVAFCGGATSAIIS